MNISKEIIRSTTKTLIFMAMVLITLFSVVTITVSALPDKEASAQSDSQSMSVIVLDTGHHHLGDGTKPELTPADAEGTSYLKTFVLYRVHGDTACITLTTKSVVPTDTAGAGLFYDQVYINGNKIGKLNDYIGTKEQDNIPRNVTIYFSTKLLHSGKNNITISSGWNSDRTDHDDFEFYDLKLKVIPASTYPYSENVRPPLRKIWSSPIRGYRSTPLPVVSQSGDVIFFTSSQADPDTPWGKETIDAIDARTGEFIRSYKTGGSFDIHGPVLYDKGMVFGSDYENIYAFEDSELKWKFNLKTYHDEYNSAPDVRLAVYNETVFTTINNAGKVFAIDARTGVLKWIYTFKPGQEPLDKEYFISYDSTYPAAGKSTVILIAHVEYLEKTMPIAIEPGTEGPDIPLDKMAFARVFALNTSNGEEVWDYSINTDYGLSGKTTVICNDLVYFGYDNKIVARALNTGRPIWSADVSWPDIYAVSDGKVFASAGPDVVALDAYNGSTVWRFQDSSGPMSVYGGLVYVGITGNENLLVLDGNTGEQLWKGGSTFGYGVSRPVLSHGRLYMSASDNRLYAFEHGEPGIQDIYVSLMGYLPLFAVTAMLVLLILFIRKIQNKSLAFGSWLLALAAVLFLSTTIMLEYIPDAGWGIGLLVFLTLPVIIITGILFLVYGIWQKRKIERSGKI